ncbi:chemotaxis protein CheB [Crenothrix sp.]|uniref:chemotaxis protein CheB n=1 Tax=Crenothrix sp. TaxID=3100433 RepID=UPI00374CA64E
MAETPIISFNIVAIGASAGGLEAFEQFFRHVPNETGMAFVLIPHLAPDHASLLTEILQRTTPMPVAEALDQIPVEPNHVYIIPPNREMTILQGILQLALPDQPRGRRMPIDLFMRSLAQDQQENAIGIILSGTGTDGTLGLRAIHETGGVTLAQEPDTAKYNGMPSSAIQAGYVSQILAVDKMPEALLLIAQSFVDYAETPIAPKTVNGINRILMQLRTSTGHDFSLYKKSALIHRIERRMAQHLIEGTDVYARYLKETPAEMQLLFNDLLINITQFFRDTEAFTVLEKEFLPALCKDKTDDYVFRVWIAGCATGEEAYSIAILLSELMEKTHQTFKVQIYSTDLAENVIATARAGFYPLNIIQDVPAERLQRFFIKEDTGYRIKKEIREMIVFAVHNIIKNPPFSKLDLLCCRNLMIYLEPELQNRLILRFHNALKPNGVLFLSPSESIGNHTDLFSVLDRKWKLYSASHALTTMPAVVANPMIEASRNTIKPIDTMKPSTEANFAELTQHNANPVITQKLKYVAKREHIEELQQQIAVMKEGYQRSIEELQCSNEEFQTTNQELETSREELQSVNEELSTVNSELKCRIEQLIDIQNDMKNLFDNTNIGIIFLDEQLTIRRFTREAIQLYPLIASDVTRPLRDIKSNFAEENLLTKAQEVLESMVSFEQEIHTVNNLWYLARIQPYRTLDNMIKGVVFTFTDISKLKETQMAMQLAQKIAENIIDTLPEPLLILNGTLQVISANPAFYRYFQVTATDTLGHKIYNLGNNQWDIPALRELLENSLPRDESFEKYAIEHNFPVIGHRKMLLNARRIVDQTGQSEHILLLIEVNI